MFAHNSFESLREQCVKCCVSEKSKHNARSRFFKEKNESKRREDEKREKKMTKKNDAKEGE